MKNPFTYTQTLRERGDTKRLIAYLKSSDEAWRSCAAEALGDLGDPVAVHPLIKAFGDECRMVCWAAVNALMKLGKHHQTVNSLFAAAQGPAGQVRYWSARTLAKLGDPRALEPLVAIIQEPEYPAWARLDAITALGNLGGEEKVEVLIATMQTAEDDLMRQRAAIVLENLNHPRALVSLDAVLQGSDTARRIEVADAVGKLCQPEALDMLYAAMREPNPPEVRTAAAKALGRMGLDPQVAEFISAALQDGDKDIRRYAQLAVAHRPVPIVVDSMFDD